jgi:hypothetical protein
MRDEERGPPSLPLSLKLQRTKKATEDNWRLGDF